MNSNGYTKKSPSLKKRYKKWLSRSVLSVLVVLMVSMGYFAYSIFGALSQGLDKDAPKSKLRYGDIEMEEHPFSVLIIGTDGDDSPGSSNWRPDVLMVATINPIKKSVKLLSIPRDTYTVIANTRGFKTKINAAAHYGYLNDIDPVQNIKETVESLLHIPIDHYIKANFQGFTDAINLLGGIDVDVPFDFSTTLLGGGIARFYKGPMHLNGPEALAYVRMRKKDPQGDHGRNIRQQKVLSHIADKLVSLNGLTNLLKISKAVGSNVTYSLSVNQIYTLLKIVKKTNEDREVIKMITTPSSDGKWFELLSKQEKLRVAKKLQDHLQIQTQYAYAEDK